MRANINFPFLKFFKKNFNRMIVNLKQFQFNIEYLNGYNFFYYLKINYIFILYIYIYILELYISLPPYPWLLEFL